LMTISAVMVKSAIRAIFFFSGSRRHTRSKRDWSSDVCSSDLEKRSRLRAEQQEQTRSEDGGRAVATEGRATVGPTAPEPTSRRSLKERGGLVGIVRRRLRRR